MTNPHNVDRPEIVEALSKFGKLIASENQSYISDIISVTSSDGVLQECSLYLIVPEISYEYKVIEIEIKTVSECEVKFITLSTSQVEPWEVSIANGTSGLTSKLLHIKSLQLFDLAIQSLRGRVDMKRSYRADVSKRMIVGEARVAVLQDGTHINAGWIEIENAMVTFYTGKGLAELWKPGMTAEEQLEAEGKKRLSMEEKIALGYIEKRPISDFREIL